MGTVVKYEDVAVGARESFTPAAPDQQSFVSPNNLKVERTNPFPPSFNEKNMFPLRRAKALLNGASYIGFWSKQKCMADKTFEAPPTLTFTAAGLYSSNGFTFVFEDWIWPTELEIVWYNGNQELSRKTFHPSSGTYFCHNQVLNFNKVSMKFLSMRFPGTWLKIRDVLFGVRLRITDEPDAEYKLTSVSVIQELNQISKEISVNVMDFSFVSEGGISFLFQRKQTMFLEHSGMLKGTFFVERGTRESEKSFTVNTQDYIAQIPQFAGGIYANKTALSLAQDILGNIPFEMDASLQARTVAGHVPITSGMEAMALLCFAIGAVCDTSNSDKVKIFELPTAIQKTYSENEIMYSQSFEENARFTGFDLSVHSYAQSSETQDLYKAADSGTGNGILVQFSEPMWGLSITSGTIAESGANYAKINANAGCVLTGKKYNHTQKVISVNNPLKNAGDLENREEVKSATLSWNPQTVAQSCYNYYLRKYNLTANAKVVLGGSKPGDKIKLETLYMGDVIGTIESMKFNPKATNDLVAEVSIC